MIQDFVLTNDKTGPPHAAPFSLNMPVATRGGASYSEREYVDWLGLAGFTATKVIAIPGPTKLVVATRG